MDHSEFAVRVENLFYLCCDIEWSVNQELNHWWWLLLERLQRICRNYRAVIRQLLHEVLPPSLSTPMWPTFILFGTRISSAIVLPFAAVIGTIGYFIEKQLSSRPKSIPYLDTSVHDDRMRRQMEVELDPEYKTEHTLKEEKKRIVPKSSLLLNTGRSGAAQHG